jgi:alanine racemase
VAEGAFRRLRSGIQGPIPPKPGKPGGAEGDETVAMAQGRSRPAWAEIDLAAVTHNARVLSRVVQPSVLCAVVKAHGYGHGGPAVAKAALAGGATGLAVALVDEGVELRQHGVPGPILLLSECGADAVDTALAYRLTPTLYSHQGIEHFTRASRTLEQRTSVHVKVDTGMHRVGASAEEVPALIQAIADEPFLRLEGMWTHLPVADGETAEDRDFTLGQLATFDRLARQLLAAGFDADIVHAANTAGAIAFPSARYGMVRCGIGLYGYLPGPAVQRAFDAASDEALRPVMSLRARVVAVRTLPAGARPSYGRLRPLPGPSVVATVPIGYADGVPRALFTAGFGVLIGGRRRPLAGMVTMDQIVVDCGDDPSVQPGDEVVLLGRQGDEEITADEWARLLGTISYEVLCGIGPRVPRLTVNGPERAGPAGPGSSPPAL